MHGQTNANRRGHRLLDQIDLARASVRGGIFDGPFFHFRDAGGDGHHDPGSDQFATVNLLDEMPQHGLRDFKIGNHAIFHGPDGDDVAGRAAEHALGFLADSQDVGRSRLDGNDRRFTQHDPLITHINERIRSPKVYPNVVGKQTLKLRKHELCLAPQHVTCVKCARSSLLTGCSPTVKASRKRRKEFQLC